MLTCSTWVQVLQHGQTVARVSKLEAEVKATKLQLQQAQQATRTAQAAQVPHSLMQRPFLRST